MKISNEMSGGSSLSSTASNRSPARSASGNVPTRTAAGLARDLRDRRIGLDSDRSPTTPRGRAEEGVRAADVEQEAAAWAQAVECIEDRGEVPLAKVPEGRCAGDCSSSTSLNVGHPQEVNVTDISIGEIPVSTRNRIEAQGFLGLDDGTLSRINYWLRLSPAICMGWAAVGTILNSWAIL